MELILKEIRENGYEVLLQTDGDFYIDNVDEVEEIPQNIATLIMQLKDELIAARGLMYRVYYECNTDRHNWAKLLKDVKNIYDFRWYQTDGGRILSWVGNNLSRANGIYRESKADESFHERVVKNLEPKIPMAFVADKDMAKTVERSLEKVKKQ